MDNYVGAQAGPPQSKHEPNCKPGDPEDALGLYHDWKLISEDGPGDVFKCFRCGRGAYD